MRLIIFVEAELYNELLDEPDDGTIASTQKGDDGSDMARNEGKISAFAFSVYSVKGSLASLEYNGTCLRAELAHDVVKLLKTQGEQHQGSSDIASTKLETDGAKRQTSGLNVSNTGRKRWAEVTRDTDLSAHNMAAVFQYPLL